IGLRVMAGQASAAITTGYARVPGQPLLSVAGVVKLKVPNVVGVPVMAPVAGLSDSPAGSTPLDTANVYGPVPPEAVIVWLYAVPTTPLGSVAGLTVMVGQTTGPAGHTATLLPAIVTAPLRASALPAT